MTEQQRGWYTYLYTCVSVYLYLEGTYEDDIFKMVLMDFSVKLNYRVYPSASRYLKDALWADREKLHIHLSKPDGSSKLGILCAIISSFLIEQAVRLSKGGNEPNTVF